MKDRLVVHTDDYREPEYPWAAVPEALNKACCDETFCLEGVQAARALRAGLEVDAVVLCRTAFVDRTKQQRAMAKGIDKVFKEWRSAAGKSVPVYELGEIDMPNEAKNETSKRRYELLSIDEQDRSAAIVASTGNPGLTYEYQEDGPPVEVWESIVGWDLDRFSKNGKILWVHASYQMPIGWALDVKFDDGKNTGHPELTMRAKFAGERECPAYGDFPGAETIWRAVLGKLITAVSVGFRRKTTVKEGVRDGKKYRDIIAELSEVSFVPVGEDEDALTVESRSRGGRLDCKEQDQRFDVSVLSGAKNLQRTQVGGIRIPARLARVGVLEYRGAGGVYREFRPHDEVSDRASLDTLQGAPVIDFVDHVKLITPEDFRGKAIGHVENVRMDGDYVVGELVINDADAIMKIDAGERADISAGYVRKPELVPGTWRSTPYDLVQRTIRYNHVALCPPNRGRSGPEVGIRLDSNDAFCVIGAETMKTIRIDGKDFEVGSDAHLAKIEEMHKAVLDKKDEELKTANAAKDGLQAKLDAKAKDDEDAKAKAAKDEEERKVKEKEASEKTKKSIKSRVRLLLRALRLMDEEDDDEKLDAKLDELDAKTDREIMLDCIKKSDEKFDATDKSDDYVASRFDTLDVSSTRGIDNVVRRIERVKQEGGGGENPIEKARLDMQERNRTAWQDKPASK